MLNKIDDSRGCNNLYFSPYTMQMKVCKSWQEQINKDNLTGLAVLKYNFSPR